MANWTGVAATLAALARPHSLQPSLVVPSIAHLDWHRLRTQAGVHGVVVDKDNCIAKPNEDDLANSDELRRAWAELLDAFGPENVLVVSNSAGDLRKDPLLIQAETVSRNLRVPVLVHRSPKPGKPCARQIAAHFLRPRSSTTTDFSAHAPSPSTAPAFSSPSLAGQTVFSPLARALVPSSRSSAPPRTTTTTDPSHRPGPTRILVIGDRLSTDMILSSRLSSLALPFSLPPNPSLPFYRRLRLRGPKIEVGEPGARIECVGVLTTRLWGREGAGTALMRAAERVVVWALGTRPTEAEGVRWREYVKGYVEEPVGNEASIEEVVASSTSTPTPPPATLTKRPRLRLHLPTLSSLQSLPSRFSQTLTSLPLRLRSLIDSLPALISHLTTRSLSRLANTLETHLPRLLSRLHAPLSRLVRIYTDPASLAPPPPSSTSTQTQTNVTARVEKWIDRAEERWDEAGRRVDRLRAEGGEEVERVRARVGRVRDEIEKVREKVVAGVGRVRALGEGRRVEKVER